MWLAYTGGMAEPKLVIKSINEKEKPKLRLVMQELAAFAVRRHCMIRDLRVIEPF